MAKKQKTDERILLMTDTAGDLPDEVLRRGGVVMLPIPIAIDGKGYLERVDFTMEEFYDRLAAAKELPATSHILSVTYEQAFEEALEQGYTDVILSTITSRGSNMFQAAVMGKKSFLEAHPGTLRITILDSGSYSLGYGYPIAEAAEMVRGGAAASEVIAYLDDWYSRCEIVFAAYSLEYAKKSGRIPVAAAFVGDVLGLRPLISIIDGETKVVEKVRGDKNVVARMVEYAVGRADNKSPTAVIYGSVTDFGGDLVKAVTKRFGHAPRLHGHLGASIAINSGPKTVGLCFRGAKRAGVRARESDFA